jgi:hypothetical protein
VTQPKASRLDVHRLHEKPADAAAPQGLIHDHVVNVPDQPETCRRHERQGRGRDQCIGLLSHDYDEPVIAQPLRQHVVGDGGKGLRELLEQTTKRCQQGDAPLRRENGGRRVHGRRVVASSQPAIWPRDRAQRCTYAPFRATVRSRSTKGPLAET